MEQVVAEGVDMQQEALLVYQVLDFTFIRIRH